MDQARGKARGEWTDSDCGPGEGADEAGDGGGGRPGLGDGRGGVHGHCHEEEDARVHHNTSQ